MVFIIFLLSQDTNGCYLCHVKKEYDKITGSRQITRGSMTMDLLNLKVSACESRPIIPAERIELTTVPGPQLNNPGIRQVTLYNLRFTIDAIKNYSLVSHYHLLITSKFQFSPLVNILRI